MRPNRWRSKIRADCWPWRNRPRFRLLLTYSVQRIGAIGTPEAVSLLVEGLGRAPTTLSVRSSSPGLNHALEGRRQVAMPAGWPRVSAALAAGPNAGIRSQALTLGVTFGDAAAVQQLRERLSNRSLAGRSARSAGRTVEDSRTASGNCLAIAVERAGHAWHRPCEAWRPSTIRKRRRQSLAFTAN